MIIFRQYQYIIATAAALFLITLTISCKKEQQEVNRAPYANAGNDQTIFLPINSVLLDGSRSTDPDDKITRYLWTNISGPSSCNISDSHAVLTTVNNLVTGVYEFELKVNDMFGLISLDTVQIVVLDEIPARKDNVVFFFRDTTGGLDAENISAIESFYPRVVLVNVRIDGYPIAEIEGVWAINYSPRCPASSNYTDATSFGSFELPPGTYEWVAESVTINLDRYPGIPDSFRKYWGSGPHKINGTITVPPGGCIVNEIIF